MTILEAYKLFIQEQMYRGNSNYTLDYYERSLKMFLNFAEMIWILRILM